MGTVHGVYLKYVGLSAISYVGLSYLTGSTEKSSTWELLGEAVASLMQNTSGSTNERSLHEARSDIHLMTAITALSLGYSTIINALIAVLFKAEYGMELIGKNRATGTIPLWSYIVLFPFHLPTRLYTYLHTVLGKKKIDTAADGSPVYKVPVASQVQPGWWVGGCYSHELQRDHWTAVIDLTVEFPETCQTAHYLSLPTWDGVPATPAQLEQAATFAANAIKQEATGQPHVLVHCAHGRGRSTTVMCACLVKAGLYSNWEEAFDKGIKPGRHVCKLNRRMRQNLAEWQAQYVDRKKGQ